MKWWFAISCSLWTIGLCLFYLANQVTKETLKWSLNFAALVYFASNFCFGWKTIIVVSFAPLLLVGIVSEQIFVVVLGAIRIFVDVWKI